jgi:hypothetical protein
VRSECSMPLVTTLSPPPPLPNDEQHFVYTYLTVLDFRPFSPLYVSSSPKCLAPTRELQKSNAFSTLLPHNKQHPPGTSNFDFRSLIFLSSVYRLLMIFSSLPQWFCRALCASTHACRWQSSVNKTALQAPVVNRLEVTTFVTLYVPATPTFTPTVTVTIGIPATSIAAVSVDPSSVTAAPAFTHGLYSFSLATAQASTGFTAVEILYAFGDWAVTPILTPVHLFLVLFVVGTVWSLVFFARFSILHQCYLEEVIRNLGHGLGTGSNILW